MNLTTNLVPYAVQPNTIYTWDALTCARTMRVSGFQVNCVVTSPPYFGLRSYLPDDSVEKSLELGSEETPDAYIRHLVDLFHVIRDVLSDDGTVWLNLGDSYAQDTKRGGKTGGKHAKGLHGDSGIGRNRHKTGLPGKSLMMIPHRVALALQADGWIVRSDIVWNKPNAMPEPVKDRPTRAHEYVFLLTRSSSYCYDSEAIKEFVTETTLERNSYPRPRDTQNGAGKTNRAGGDDRAGNTGTLSKQDAVGKRSYTGFNDRYFSQEQSEKRNKRDVWNIATQPSSIPHYAMMPEALVEPCILAGCPAGGIVYDPFAGVGTTALVAQRLRRQYIGSEINPESAAWARARLANRVEEHAAATQGKPHTQYMFGEQPA